MFLNLKIIKSLRLKLTKVKFIDEKGVLSEIFTTLTNFLVQYRKLII